MVSQVQSLWRSVYLLVRTNFAHNGDITLYLKANFMAVIGSYVDSINTGTFVIP